MQIKHAVIFAVSLSPRWAITTLITLQGDEKYISLPVVLAVSRSACWASTTPIALQGDGKNIVQQLQHLVVDRIVGRLQNSSP
jgi:hypothetical protein